MKRFRKIFVYAGGTDGGRSAIRRGVDLARRNSAELSIVEVLPELTPAMEWLQQIDPLQDVEVIACEEAIRRLDDVCKGIVPPDIPVNKRVLTGKPYVEIIREVLACRYDLVIATSESPHGAGEHIFGTTAFRLLRKCPCPVWVIKPEAAPQFERILAAVDVSTTNYGEKRLNHDIVEIAASLARLEEAELHIATSAQLWMEAWLQQTDRYTSLDMDRIARERTRRAESAMTTLIRRTIDTDQHMTHVVSGSPERTIPRLAADLHADLIVMGTVGRTGLSGVVMGNTSEQILNRINCAVLALKPPGFLSPIQQQGATAAGR